MDRQLDPLHLKPIGDTSYLPMLFGSGAFRILLGVALVVSLVLVPLTYWALDNQHPYDFIGEESFIVPQEAVGNDQMLVKWKVNVHRTCAGFIDRQLFDPRTGVILAQYETQPAAAAGLVKDGYLNKTFLLPRAIQTGWIGYRSRMQYWCNPLQRIWPISYTTPSLYFKVAG